MRLQIHPPGTPTRLCIASVAIPSAPVPRWPQLKTEVWLRLPPLLHGQQRIVDTGGQVERFQKRMTKAGSPSNSDGCG